jgi:hypothetical protein
MKKLAVGLAAAMIMTASPAEASSVVGKASSILILANGLVFFNMSGTRTTSPSCAAGLPLRWVFNGATAAGQARLSLLLTAYSTGKSLEITGTGACTDWNDTETMDYFQTQD